MHYAKNTRANETFIHWHVWKLELMVSWGTPAVWTTKVKAGKYRKEFAGFLGRFSFSFCYVNYR